MITQDQIDQAAIQYNQTKDPELKKLWYKLVKEYANGIDSSQRRIVSVDSCHKRDDGTYLVIGRSRMHGSL